jgi:hypothetical protein
MIGDATDRDINRRLDALEARDYRGELDNEARQMAGCLGGYSQTDDDTDTVDLREEAWD